MMALLEIVRSMLVGVFEALTPSLALASGQTPFWAAVSALAAATVLWLLSGFVNDLLWACLQGHAERLRTRTRAEADELEASGSVVGVVMHSETTDIRSWALAVGCAVSDMLHLAVGLYMWLTTALVMVWSIAAAVGIFV